MSSANALKTKNPAESLALWIAQNQPELFKALAAKAHQQGQLNGITDWLSSVGSSLGTAVKAVGSFVASPGGSAAIGSLAGAYLQTQAQKNALKVQLAQAQAGYAMQPIYSAGTTGTYYVDPVTGQQMPLTSTLTSQLMPQSITTILPYLLGGVGLLFVLFMASGKRK